MFAERHGLDLESLSSLPPTSAISGVTPASHACAVVVPQEKNAAARKEQRRKERENMATMDVQMQRAEAAKAVRASLRVSLTDPCHAG